MCPLGANGDLKILYSLPDISENLAGRPPSLHDYGFRTPSKLRSAWCSVPPILTLPIIAATAGVHVSAPSLLAFAVLAITVTVNEEVWFRGVVLAVLRPHGARVAIVGTSLLFGIPHLTNLLDGESLAVAGLQLAFAVLFGVVAAELESGWSLGAVQKAFPSKGEMLSAAFARLRA